MMGTCRCCGAAIAHTRTHAGQWVCTMCGYPFARVVLAVRQGVPTLGTAPAVIGDLIRCGYGPTCGRATVSRAHTRPVYGGPWLVHCSCGQQVGVGQVAWQAAMDRARTWTRTCAQQRALIVSTARTRADGGACIVRYRAQS